LHYNNHKWNENKTRTKWCWAAGSSFWVWCRSWCITGFSTGLRRLLFNWVHATLVHRYIWLHDLQCWIFISYLADKMIILTVFQHILEQASAFSIYFLVWFSINVQMHWLTTKRTPLFFVFLQFDCSKSCFYCKIWPSLFSNCLPRFEIEISSAWQFKAISSLRYHPSIVIAPWSLVRIVLFFISSSFLSILHKSLIVFDSGQFLGHSRSSMLLASKTFLDFFAE